MVYEKLIGYAEDILIEIYEGDKEAFEKDCKSVET